MRLNPNTTIHAGQRVRIAVERYPFLPLGTETITVCDSNDAAGAVVVECPPPPGRPNANRQTLPIDDVEVV